MDHPRSRRDTPPPSVGFISLGCAKNLVDSQVMAGRLLRGGLRLAPSPERADVILVNTCAFIEDARAEAVEQIEGACARKARGHCRAVIVAGCYPQRYPGTVAARFPAVDAFIGLDQLDHLPRIVRMVLSGDRTHRVDVTPAPHRLYEPDLPQLVFTGAPFAYLKISEGCNHGCAFCAIPGIRGRYRSRPARAILREAEQLLANGIRELCLVSQDTTAYGLDRADRNGLAGLVRKLGRLGGTFWVRVLYGYPPLVSDALLTAMAETPQACHYLDIPLQHSHPDILRAMRRAGTVRAVGTLAARARAALQGVSLRTTFLVGFPGETDEHFGHLLDFVTAAEFDHVGVFTYSAEEGTPAAAMGGAVDPAVALERKNRLLDAQSRVLDRKAAALLGRELPLLLEARQGRTWRGRSYRQAPEVDGTTRVSGVARDTRPGTFVRARITGHDGCDLLAQALPERRAADSQVPLFSLPAARR